jgi:hypothetical protein
MAGGPPRPQAAPVEEADAWRLDTWGRGIGQVGTWLGQAVRALVLDRSAYQEVVQDATMTGPALLVALVASILVSVVRAGGFNLWPALGNSGLWLLRVLVVTLLAQSRGSTTVRPSIQAKSSTLWVARGRWCTSAVAATNASPSDSLCCRRSATAWSSTS